MQKIQKLQAGQFYWIRHTGNNHEPLFVENKNYTFFIGLMQRHLAESYLIVAYSLIETELHLVLRVKDRSEIPLRYPKKLHQPLSNLFNSYCKAFNKEYGRCGSLFRVRYKRNQLDGNASLEDAIRQTHLLPARTGRDFRYYPFSSYQKE